MTMKMVRLTMMLTMARMMVMKMMMKMVSSCHCLWRSCPKHRYLQHFLLFVQHAAQDTLSQAS